MLSGSIFFPVPVNIKTFTLTDEYRLAANTGNPDHRRSATVNDLLKIKVELHRRQRFG